MTGAVRASSHSSVDGGTKLRVQLTARLRIDKKCTRKELAHCLFQTAITGISAHDRGSRFGADRDRNHDRNEIVGRTWPVFVSVARREADRIACPVPTSQGIPIGLAQAERVLPSRRISLGVAPASLGGDGHRTSCLEAGIASAERDISGILCAKSDLTATLSPFPQIMSRTHRTRNFKNKLNSLATEFAHRGLLDRLNTMPCSKR